MYAITVIGVRFNLYNLGLPNGAIDNHSSYHEEIESLNPYDATPIYGQEPRERKLAMLSDRGE